MEAFADRGFRGASLDSIAEGVGLTRQGLLHYFPSKTDLLLAVLDQRDRDDEQWAAELQAQGHRPLGDALRELLRRVYDEPQLIQLFTVVVAESLQPEHPAHGHIRDRYSAARDRWAAGIAQEQALGNISPTVDAAALGVALMALMDGLHVQHLLDPNVDVVAALEQVVALVGPPDPRQ